MKKLPTFFSNAGGGNLGNFILASLLFLIETLFFSTSAFSQGRTIQGTVQTEQGKPIYGATVIVQNTTLGTTTDADGKFSIKLDAGTQPVLQISFIGYETQTVPAAGKTQVEVILREAVNEMDDVVVVGYGTMRKKDLTAPSPALTARHSPPAKPARFRTPFKGLCPESP